MIGFFFANITVLIVGWLIENKSGYPPALFRRIGHPVTWIGRVISLLDAAFNQPTWPFVMRRLAGVMAIIVTVTLPVALSIMAQMLLLAFLPPWLAWPILGVAAASLLAAKSLRDHVHAVVDGLEINLEQGRTAVGMIVGRDVSALDEAGVSRAAIESLAENTADGIVAPAFWCLLFGLPGLVAYKAINTADSMIGHRSERHLAFGWAAARLDDLANLPFSRITALLFSAGAAFLPGASSQNAWRMAMRDAGKHQSPNAGWPEAAMAGALGFALGGPRSYQGEIMALPVMGEGRNALTRQDIARAMGLQSRSLLLLLTLLIVLFLLLAWM
jgi:adenosylcobinamide-phosphate synthase